MVVDSNGRGVSGIEVKEYNGDRFRTNSSGIVTLLLEHTNTTIYVNSFTAYDGAVSGMSPIMTYDTSGRSR